MIFGSILHTYPLLDLLVKTNCLYKHIGLTINLSGTPNGRFNHQTAKKIGGVVVITTAHPHSTKPELRFCAGSNPVCGVLEIGDEDLSQWSRVE